MRFSLLLVVIFLTVGCATQARYVKQVEADYTLEQQKQAQQEAMNEKLDGRLTLKRKVALGRITNETRYGRSLLRDDHNDPVGKQVADMLSKALTESGNFLVFERPDIGRLKDEAELTSSKMNVVGVDALIIGSLTEFGRKTVGEAGFWSESKKQIAHAKVEFRLVDPKTGHSFFSTTGSGEASNEVSSVAGYGSRASYDGTLGDAAIGQAISGAISKLVNELLSRPWETSVLDVKGDFVYISGGKSQGIKQGMVFSVESPGKQVKSQQTGFVITLPGQEIASIQVSELFGDDETSEGSVTKIVKGTVSGYDIEKLIIKKKD